MGALKTLFILLSILNLSSCAKTKYMFEQGSGQISLLWNAKENQKVLDDPKVDSKIKEKIKRIQIFKDHFYNFWKRDPSKIYSKTTFLKGEAVTYLVISSKYFQIKPLKECFPFMGCFPYIGFFSKESAKEYRQRKEEENFETYMRPVYAYSTLGYFTDTILSSFFYYKDIELAELIFHELFHTIFFVKNEVALNENLANYFSKEMVKDYFQDDPAYDQGQENLEKSQFLRLALVELVKELNSLYEKRNASQLSKEEVIKIRDDFMKDTFKPRIQATCNKHKIKNCYPLNRDWNNASFAAFMTYSKKADKLTMLRNKLNLDLRGFYGYIVKKYEEYEELDPDDGFSNFLFKDL